MAGRAFARKCGYWVEEVKIVSVQGLIRDRIHGANYSFFFGYWN